jgi:chemotaxis response regulator CheB
MILPSADDPFADPNHGQKEATAAHGRWFRPREHGGAEKRPRGSGAKKKPHRTQSSDLFPILGIGDSAGGLAALKTFFTHVPEDSGFAFVVVVHLSPEHKSHLAELLQPHVRMPVDQVGQTVPLEPNHVYVIPPNANLDTIDTHLRLTELEKRRQEARPSTISSARWRRRMTDRRSGSS